MAKLRTSLPRSRLEKLRSQEQSQPVLSCDYIDTFTKGLEVLKARSRKPGSCEEALSKVWTWCFKTQPILRAEPRSFCFFLRDEEEMRFWSESRQAVEATVAQTSGLVNYFFFRQTGFCDYCACFNRFPIPKQDFYKTLSLGVGNLLKHFTTVFTLFTCQSTVCICQRSEKLKWYQPRVGKSLFS